MTVLDELPMAAGWVEVPLRAVAIKVSEPGYGHLQPLSVYLEAGVVPRSSRDDNHNQLGENIEKYQRVLPDDLVFNKLRTWQGGFGISRNEGIVSPAYIIARPITGAIHPRFLGYLLKSAPYLAELTRLSKWMPPSQFDISWESIRDLRLRMPAIDEQRRIADYLDSELVKITRLGDLLKQQVVKIDEVFTSAINESILSADQSNLTYFRYLVTESNTRANGQPDLPLLSVSKHRGIIPRSELMEDQGRAESLDNYKVCEIGDIVVNRMSASSGALGLSAVRGVVSPDYSVLKPSRLADPQYLEMLMKSPWFISQMVMRLRGIGGIGGEASVRTPRVSIADLGDVRVQLPSQIDQKKLALKFSIAHEKTQILLAQLDEALGLASQLRVSIVTAAVTGTFDVTTGRSVT